MTQAARAPEDVKYHNYRECFRKIATEEGIMGFYRGMSIMFLKSIGGALAMTMFTIYGS